MKFRKVLSLVCCIGVGLSLMACDIAPKQEKPTKDAKSIIEEVVQEKAESSSNGEKLKSLFKEPESEEQESKETESEELDESRYDYLSSSEEDLLIMLIDHIKDEGIRSYFVEELINLSDDTINGLEEVLLNDPERLEEFSSYGFKTVEKGGKILVVFDDGTELSIKELKEYLTILMDILGYLHGTEGSYTIQEPAKDTSSSSDESWTSSANLDLSGYIEILLENEQGRAMVESIVSLTDSDLEGLADKLENDSKYYSLVQKQLPEGVTIKVEDGEIIYDVYGREIPFKQMRDQMIDVITAEEAELAEQSKKYSLDVSNHDNLDVQYSDSIKPVTFETATLLNNEYVKVDVTDTKREYGQYRINLNVENLTSNKLNLYSERIVVNGCDIDAYGNIYATVPAKSTVESWISLDDEIAKQVGIDTIKTVDVYFKATGSAFEDLFKTTVTLESQENKNYTQKFVEYPVVYEDDYIQIELVRAGESDGYEVNTVGAFVINKSDREGRVNININEVNGEEAESYNPVDMIPGIERYYTDMVYSYNGINLAEVEDIKDLNVTVEVFDSQYNKLEDNTFNIHLQK